MLVVCSICGRFPVAGRVEFANYDPSPRWLPGDPVPTGWSNEIGVEDSTGVGVFCDDHLKAARKLRSLTSIEAVRQLKAKHPPPLQAFLRRKWVQPRHKFVPYPPRRQARWRGWILAGVIAVIFTVVLVGTIYALKHSRTHNGLNTISPPATTMTDDAKTTWPDVR